MKIVLLCILSVYTCSTMANTWTQEDALRHVASGYQQLLMTNSNVYFENLTCRDDFCSSQIKYSSYSIGYMNFRLLDNSKVNVIIILNGVNTDNFNLRYRCPLQNECFFMF